MSTFFYLLGGIITLFGLGGVVSSIMSDKARIQKNWIGGLIFMVPGLLLIWLTYAVSTGAEPSPQPETTEQRDRSHSRGRAKVKAERYVRQHLSRPSTADFSGVIDTEIEHLGGGTYRVRGTVSAENGFGAARQHRYDVTLSDDGTRRWTLDEIRVE